MIKSFFLKLVYNWKILLADPAYRLSALSGMLLLGGAYVINHFASSYHDAMVLTPVGDILLDKIPTYNLEFIYTWVMYFLILLMIVYPLFIKPEIAPFTAKTVAVLMIFRAFFTIMTNFGPPDGFFYDSVKANEFALSFFLYRNDLFFSGHTAYPFLFFFLVRDSWVKWIFLLGTATQAVTVLLMHIHYSIDVFAALFIAYGTYSLSDTIFKKLNLRFQNRLRVYGADVYYRIKDKIKNKLNQSHENSTD